MASICQRVTRAEQKAAVGFATLLPAEQREVIDTLHGMFRGITDQQRASARSLEVGADLERTMMGDADSSEQFDYVASALTSQTVEPAARESTAAIVNTDA